MKTHERYTVQYPADILMDGLIVDYRPQSIIIEPILYKQVLLGVIILASVSPFSEDSLDMLATCAPILSMAFNNAITHQQMQRLAALDSLTGIYNRRFGYNRIQEEFSRAIRSGTSLSLIMLPRQSLIWAVLRKDDQPKRLVWSLCATFLGVMCLSGDVYDISPAQWAVVDEAIRFYRSVSHILEDGTTRRHGEKIASYRHPDGWQLVERTAANGMEKLIVAHVYDKNAREIRLDLQGNYRISRCFAEEANCAGIRDGVLTLTLADGACALHLCAQ